jgi:hypothetical protein
VWPQRPVAAARNLLEHELEGLGILAPPDDKGCRSLRTSALLPSLGSPQEIEQNLAEVAQFLPEVRARGLVRPSLDDHGRPGPLTSEQLATLAGRKGNRTTVLIGSPALGVELTTEALQGKQPGLRRIEVAHDGGNFRRLLRTGEPGETRMTVVSELWRKTSQRETCQESLENAQNEDFLPEDRDASRAVILIAGPSNAEWLENDLYHNPQRDDVVVTLDRFTARTLPLQWRDQARLEELGSSQLRASVLRLTGGWPAIVDSLAQRTRKAGAAKALEELRDEQKDRAWPGQFLQSTGALGVTRDLELLVAAMADYGEPCTIDDLNELGLNRGIRDVARTVTLANWFALLDEADDQSLRLAPLIADAWKRYEAEQ